MRKLMIRSAATAVVLMMTVLQGLATAAESKKAADARPDQVVLKWAGCGISKKAFMTEMAAAYEKKTGVKIDLKGGGATKGIRQTASGETDFGGSCRYKIDGHPEEATVELKPVAWDALVVIVHKDNPVKDITLDQIRGLYLGKIKNWKELGGSDKPIKLYVRKGKSSGVGRAIRKLVFANYEQDFVAHEVVKSSGPLEKAVEKDVDAIGITGISSARKRKVNFLKLEGKEATFDNIKNGDYLLYRPLYLAIRSDSKNIKEVNKFFSFTHSPAGRKIMIANGTVPYLDALGLVMKQIEQEKRAEEIGLYRNQ